VDLRYVSAAGPRSWKNKNACHHTTLLWQSSSTAGTLFRRGPLPFPCGGR
jgi:hypothetical protein